MQSSTFYSLAFFVGLSSIFSGCCGVPISGGCGSCGVASRGCNTCPGLLHGELAGRVRSAIIGGCSSGCGEVYYGEQTNEPPTCDPCSCNGEFSGENCGPCRPLIQRLQHLWGTSYTGSCGCDSCNSGGCGSDAYASHHSGSGYCPNCRDGVAGNPSSHTRHSRQHVSRTPSHSQAISEQSSHDSSLQESPEPTPMKTSSPRFEPVPDPVSDAPVRSTPMKAERPTTSQSNQSRTIPTSSQPKQSRLVRE